MIAKKILPIILAGSVAFGYSCSNSEREYTVFKGKVGDYYATLTHITDGEEGTYIATFRNKKGQIITFEDEWIKDGSKKLGLGRIDYASFKSKDSGFECFYDPGTKEKWPGRCSVLLRKAKRLQKSLIKAIKEQKTKKENKTIDEINNF